MSNPDHLAKLLQGPEAWNAWRSENPDLVPDLSDTALTGRAGIAARMLTGLDLRGAMMQNADLGAASLSEADLTEASLEGAELSGAQISRCVLAYADLSDANLTGARLDNSDLTGANLSRARLAGADLELAVGLTNAQIGAAYCDVETRLPVYLDIADIYKDPNADEDEEDEPGLEAEGDSSEPKPPQPRKRPPNPYVLLETTPHASTMELRTAYLRLAKKYHPDVNPGNAAAEQRFKDINEAYRRASARRRLRETSERKRTRTFWAAALAFFLISTAATSVVVYRISAPSGAELQREAAAIPVPQEPRTDRLSSKGPAVEIAAKPVDDEPPAAEPAGSLALSISTAKDDGASPAADPAPATPPSAEPALAAPKPTPPQQAASSEPAPDGDDPGADPERPAAAVAPPSEQPPAGIADAPETTESVAQEPQPGSAPAAANGEPEAGAAEAPQRTARLIEGDNDETEFTAWQSTTQSGTIAAFRAYLINFPGGRHVGEARMHLAALESEIAERKEEEAAWSRAQRGGARNGFLAYLNAYPQGRFAGDAKKKLSALDAKSASLHKEDEAWAKARAQHSHKAYSNYLIEYPNGRYAAKAQETIAEVQSRPQPPSSQPRNGSRPEPAADDRQSRQSLRFPSSDEPFIERLPRPH